MKFFNWMQNKFNGGQGNRKSPNAASATYHAKQEEFSDWPHGLLAIGTFGNNELKENSETKTQQSSCDLHDHDPYHDHNHPSNSSSQRLPDDFTPEEVGKFQKELRKLLSRKPPSSKAEAEAADLPLDKFLNCPSSLEVDRRDSNTFCSDSDHHDYIDEDIERTIRVILGRCKDVCMENNNKAIRKKSLSFLLKKMFVCGSGFAPTPSLRETLLQESRMEKFLRTMLSKKIYSQNSSRASSMKRYIGDKPTPKKEREDETRERTEDGGKWVKTDSEYIVLEI